MTFTEICLLGCGNKRGTACPSVIHSQGAAGALTLDEGVLCQYWQRDGHKKPALNVEAVSRSLLMYDAANMRIIFEIAIIFSIFF